MSIKITTQSLPTGEVGKDYHAQLTVETDPATDVTWRAPVSWPRELGLDPQTGIISGLCSEVSDTAVVVIAKRADNDAEDQKTLRLTIDKYERLEIATKCLPDGSVGVPYSVALQATGGKTPYKWQAGPLPRGLTVKEGKIEGIPEEEWKQPTVLEVFDSLVPPGSAKKEVVLSVGHPPVAIKRFEVIPQSIKSRGVATLYWDVEHATQAGIEPPIDCPVVPGVGRCSVSTIRDTTFTITCTGPGGEASQSTSLHANDVVRILSIHVEPHQSNPDLGIVSWEVENAERTEFWLPGMIVGRISGETTIMINWTREYTLFAFGLEGPVSMPYSHPPR